MKEKEGKFYFTHQFIERLNEAVKRSRIDLDWFERQIMANLARYPCQGRLFLNRPTQDSNNQRLCWQLAQRFCCHELRELSENGWIILYLNHFPHIYFVALMPLPFAESPLIEQQWQRGE